MGVQHLTGVLLVFLVVLSKDQGNQVAPFVQDGQLVELVIPDDVIGLAQGQPLPAVYDIRQGRHKVLDRRIGIQAGNPVIPAGHDAHQLAIGAAVLGNGDGRVARLLLEADDIGQLVIGREVAVTGDKTGLKTLDPMDHVALVLDGLGTEDERKAPLPGQGHGHPVIRDRLHDGRNHGNAELDGAFFLSPPVLDQGAGKGDPVRGTVMAGPIGNQEKFTEGAG